MQLTRLGPYEIGKPLGKGGMGSVFAATDTNTGQRVAIKALTPHLATAEGFRDRFEAEIESLKTLKHDGIVRLYGYGEQDGVLFYSMELVEGISLEDELKAGRRFNWREVTSIAVQLSLALKHAHDHGIVHRDIKPANILLSGDDRVKLADFGIARLFGNTSLTTAGGVLGTADYMSPEQADGRPVTARCDQYSLGGVMYALLAGRPPFFAKNLPQMLQLQRFANPEPVRRYAPDTPEQLERVIMQLLSKDPADRFPNTQVLARHLQALAMALSRPAADDFALDADHMVHDRRVRSDDDELLAVDRTQAEVEIPNTRTESPASDSARNGREITSSQEAATLAADEHEPKKAVNDVGASMPKVGDTEAMSPARPTHFTTVEEELARPRPQHRRSWITLIAQLAGLVAALAGMAAIAMYASRPPSADKLYDQITTTVENDENGLIGNIEPEVDQFLALFPDDSRAAEIQQFKERIELDKLERRLQRDSRRNGSADASTSPAQLLYLDAVEKAQTSPETAVRMLESLVALYRVPAGAPDGASNAKSARDEIEEQRRTKSFVQLAERRLAVLRSDLAERRSAQVASIKERLESAATLATKNPHDAAAMYRAIINLYESDDWAKEVVDQARSRLLELETNKTQ